MRRLALALILAAGIAAARGLADELDYLVPIWNVPVAATPPTVDGNIGADEWAGAAAGTGLVDFLSRFFVTRNARVWVTADSDYLYVAMRSPLPGHGQLRARVTENDVRWVFQDDAIEVVVKPYQDREGESGFESLYHMIYNSKDAVYDIKRSKGIGQNFIQWNTTAERANGVRDGHWDWEMRIPASDFGFAKIPVGTTWRVAVVRNWKNPAAWASITPGYSCNSVGSYIKAQVVAAGPHFQLDALGDIKAGQLRARGKVYGDGQFTMKATVQTWPDRQDLAVKEVSGPAGDLAVDLDYTPENGNLLLVDVTDAAGAVVWHQAWQFKPWTEDERAVLAQWNEPPAPKDKFGVQRYHWVAEERLEVDCDLDMYVQLDQVAAVKAALLAGDKTVAEGQATVVDDMANLDLPLTGLKVGKYRVVVQGVDKDGNVVGKEQSYPFEIKEWEWLGNDIGKAPIVLPPYEPIDTAPGQAHVISRTYSFAPTGLFEQIVNLGQKMLPEPQQLTATVNGKPATLTVVEPFAWTSAEPHLAVGQAKLKFGALPVTVTVDLEYDGFAIYTFDLAEAPGVQLDKLDLTIALARDKAPLYHVVGERHTDTIAGELPAGDGVVWDSRTPANMDILGTFQPYVWYGNEEMGIGWMAESDKGWHTADDHPLMDIVRGKNTVQLRWHLVDLPTPMTKARRIQFGLMATPAKPLPEDWRRWSLWDPKSPLHPTRRLSIDFSRDWTYGFGGSFYPAAHDYSRVEYPLKKAINRGLNRPVFYTGFGYIAMNYPEVQYFKAEWLGKEFQTYSAIDRFADRKIWGDDRQAYITSGAALTESFMDFAVFYYDKLFKQTAFRGIYYDLFNPGFSARQDLGAYIRDDGKLQKANNLFHKRRFIRRVSTAMLEAGVEPVTIVHITGTAIAPALAFAEVGWDAEMRFPPEGRDHMDTWTFDLVRAETMGKQHGFIPFFLQGGGRPLIGMLGAHDILQPRADKDGNLHAYQQPLADFGVGVGHRDVVFHGYWKNAVRTGDPDVFCSYYTRPGRALLLVVNRAETAKDVTLTVDWAAVGVTPGACRDPQELADINWQPGAKEVRLTVPRHDYRLIRAE